jgi:hypothetical protein
MQMDTSDNTLAVVDPSPPSAAVASDDTVMADASVAHESEGEISTDDSLTTIYY